MQLLSHSRIISFISLLGLIKPQFIYVFHLFITVFNSVIAISQFYLGQFK